jgi:membrane protease YdiL (CAAX protease family)
MVQLENPYAHTRPQTRTLLSIPVLFLLGYLVSRHAGFLFAYQYTITVLATILVSYCFDREIISGRRLFGKDFVDLSRISLFVYPILLAVALVLFSKYLVRTPVYHLHFSSMGAQGKAELFMLMIIVAVPATEILFRGYLQYVMMHIFGGITGSIIAGLVYAGFFVVLSKNIWLLLIAAAMSGLLSYLYYRHKSVSATVIAHEILALALFIFHF